MASSLTPVDDTAVISADVTIALEPGVEQTFPGARVETLSGAGKVCVMITIWADPAELLLWGDLS